MSSSLAAQLAGIKANNNATILDKSKRKKIHSVSLVYEPKEAAAQDFESIYFASLEAFRELESVDRRFSTFNNTLFSETSIRFDRLVQDQDSAAALNQTIERFLMLIAGYLHLQPAFRALEWLVRRFHIQIHNTESLLLAALPWHAGEEFIRILDIIAPHQLPALFQFLAASRQSLKGPSKNAIVRVMAKDDQLFEVVNRYVLQSIQLGYAYNRQLIFWSSVDICICMVFREQGSDEIVDKLLPIIAEVLPQSKRPSAQIAAYMIETVVCSQFTLSDDVIDATVTTIAANTSASTQAIACIAQLVKYASTEYTQQPFSTQQWEFVGAIDTNEIIDLAKQYDVSRFVLKWALTLELNDYAKLHTVLATTKLHETHEKAIEAKIFDAIEAGGPFNPKLNETLLALVEWALAVDADIASTKIDELELALQTSIERPNQDDDDFVPPIANGTNGHTPVGSTRESLVEKSANMEQSTRMSFLDAPMGMDERTELWINASSHPEISKDELVSLARVAPEATMSFLLAFALGPWPVVSRSAAIRALTAKLSEEDAANVDYQALIPALLYLLADPESRIRRYAADALRTLKDIKLSKSQLRWGEKVYGETSKRLVWLGRNDLGSILKRLGENLEECILDNEYVFALCRQAGKAAWSEFLCSHAVATPLPQILWFTLRALVNFKGVIKHLAPLLEDWFNPDTQAKWSRATKLTKFPLERIEAALVRVVRTNDPVGVNFLQMAFKRGGVMADVASEHLAHLWTEGVFKPDTQQTLCEALVDLSVSENASFDPAEALAKLQPFSTELFATLLERARLKTTNNKQQQAAEAQKRRRRRSSSSMQLRSASVEMLSYAERHLRKVTLILELLDRVATTLDMDAQNASRIFGAMFDILEELLSLGTDSKLPVLYTEELLVNCMISLVDNVIKHPKVASAISMASIRVNLIVSCIRTSTSPQVQNRLLLLIASLATLSPDLVLHSVMPIFTFMGANTVRLDNDFSAHVIQRTISQVIPALVACGDKHEEIEMALMSFVAAFPHIPRHRRNKLYGALIKTLGPEESLYKLLLLLGHRYGESLLQKRSSDAKAIVHFTTTFLRSFTVHDQLEALDKYINFVPATTRTTGDSDNSDSDSSAMEIEAERFGLQKIKEAINKFPKMRDMLLEFLVLTEGNTQTISGTQPLRAQIAASQDQFTPEQLQLLTSMVDRLLVLQAQSSTVVLALLSKTLELLPIGQFVETVLPLLDGASPEIQERVMALIGTKFDFESSSDRAAVTAADAMVQRLEQRIGSAPVVVDTIDQLIVKFGTHMAPESELRLLDVLCGTAGLLNPSQEMVISAVNCVNSLCQQLGVRMIGYFPRILPVLFAKCESAEESEDENTQTLELATFALFGGLVQRIPAFMGPVAKQAVSLVLASHTDTQPRRQLLELVNTKMDTQEVLGIYASTWDSAVRGGMSSIELFFGSLESLVELSSKRDIVAKAAALGSLMTSWFNTRATLRFGANETNQIEGRAVTCGLHIVLKLNDKVFRPLFVQIVRWGFEEQSSSVGAELRYVPVLKFVCKLLMTLKSIVTNYFGYILDHVCAIASEPLSEEAGSTELAGLVRKLILQALYLSFNSDQDDFWQAPSRFEKILDVLLLQFRATTVVQGPLLVKAVTALAESSSSQQHRKKINDDVVKLLTSGSASQKIWAIRTLSGLYTSLGEDWISNLPQLVPLIAELLDDENEDVEDETRKSLVPVIEDVLGESLDRYLA